MALEIFNFVLMYKFSNSGDNQFHKLKLNVLQYGFLKKSFNYAYTFAS